MAMAPPSTVQGGNLTTNVGNFPINTDFHTALVNADRARRQYQASGSEADKKQWQYWSTKQNVLDSIAKYNRGDETVPQNVYDVRTQNWQQNWAPLASQYESGAGLTEAGRPNGYFGFAAYEQAGGDPNKLADAIGLKAQQDAKKNRGFIRKAATSIVPAAIGIGLGTLGTAALAPGLFAGGSGVTGLAAGDTASSGLLGSLGSNFTTRTALSGALRGGLSGLASGGDFGDALKGAALGGALGGFAPSIGSSLGLGSVGQNALTGALTGASGGLATGDYKSALLGGALGGAGSYVTSGGSIPGLGRAAETINWNQGGSSVLNPGSGILGSLTRSVGSGIGGGSSSLGGGSMLGGTSGLGSLLKAGGSLYAQGRMEDENEAIRRRLMGAADAQDAYLREAQGMYDPYQQSGLAANQQLSQALAAGFNPSDLAEDPSYKFRLQQGEKALGRQMAAQGLGQSGAALKAAQEYGQGLAAEQYQQAYNNWLAQNQQLAGQAGAGLGATSAQAGLSGALGQSQAMRGGLDAQVAARNAEIEQQRIATLLGLGGNLFGLGSIF